MNLTLIGMSGAGKSYVGQHVARGLGLEFIDTDASIEEEARRTLPEIIADIGEEAFVELESRATIERTKGKDNLLISTGGSVIYSPHAMEHLRGISTVVYLRVPYEMIEHRVGGDEDRIGRIVGLGNRTLKALYDERAPLYEGCAHFVVDIGTLDLENSVEAIMRIARVANS